MYSWIFGTYYYLQELLEIIDSVEKKREEKRKKNLRNDKKFADELKEALQGFAIIEPTTPL